jgi:colanic acid biosynthesis glycosyl transferase WcaI
VGRVEQVGSLTLSRASNIGRAANYVSYLVLASLRALFRRPADITISGSDPPLAIWPALIAARGKPVIYALQDLHPDLGLAAGWIHPGIATRFWEKLHTLALRRATRVICLGETMAERILRKGVDAARVQVIPHGAPTDLGSPDDIAIASLRKGSNFVVLHAGNIGWGGAWESIVEASKMLKDEATFVFVGDGVRADEIRRAGLDVVPFRPSSEVASVMCAGDLQLVTVRPGAEGLIVPSKMYSILAHGRPILAVASQYSEVANLVSRSAGLLADPENPLDIAEKVRWAIRHPKELSAMGAQARRLASQTQREDQLKKLVALVNEVAAN